jgi:hypothetical protein
MIIIFFIQYWIDKNNLLRVSSLKYEASFFICIGAYRLLAFAIIIFTAANLMFSARVEIDFNIINLLSFFVSIFVFIIMLFDGPF